MERMATSVEGVCNEASVLKSSGSELMRTGLSIDLNLPLPVIVNGVDCQHFSIRQYVAEMRKKDMKNCSPFGPSSGPLEKLPHLTIPEHKLGQCANCIHNIGTNESEGDIIGVRVEQTGNSDTKVILSKQCSTRETEINFPVANLLNNSTNTESTQSNNENDKIVPNERPCADDRDTEQCHLQNGSKSVKFKHTSDKDSGISRKKHKQLAQIIDGVSLQIPLKGKNNGLGTNGSGANVLIQSLDASQSTKKFEGHLRNNSEPLHEKERDSDLNKLLEARQASSHMNVAPDKNFQRGRLSKDKDFIQMTIGMGTVTSRPENKLYYKEKLSQTLRNFRSAEKHVRNDKIQTKDMTDWPLTLQKGNKSCDPLKSNVVELGQSSRNEKIDLNHGQIFLNPLKWRAIQSHPMETPRTNNNINLNKVQGHSYVTIPQKNQQSMKIIERGPSTYVPPMGIVEMSWNQHERIHPQTLNRVLSWSNPLSTSFRPLDPNVNANFEFLRGSTAMAHQQFKLSNVVQVSAPVSTEWGLKHGIWSHTAQNIRFRPNNSQNYRNQENPKHGQATPSLLQIGRTISDIKAVNLKGAEHMRTTCMESLNPFSSGNMSATQLLKNQERPFAPCNFHPPFCMDRNSDQVVYLGTKDKKRKAYAPEQLGGRKLQHATSSSGLLCPTRDSCPRVDLMQDDNISKSLDVGGRSIHAVVLPVSSIARMDPPCLLNQNPADIADADDERYFRTVKDQRIRGKFRADVNLNGRKRQRRK